MLIVVNWLPDFLEYIYNNIFYLYKLYVVLYKFNISLKFFFGYFFNFIRYYITNNIFLFYISKPIVFIYNYLNFLFVWINRRFLKKKKRFRIYYKFHNVRYWKFMLFFLYIKLFFHMWKRRNLYKKKELIMIVIFAHITVLLLLHFSLGIFTQFDQAFLFTISFIYLMILIFKR